jgi:hypothetical protein
MVDGNDGDEGPTRKFIGGVEHNFGHLASLHKAHWCRWRCVSVAPVADVRGGVQCGRHNSKCHGSSPEGHIFGFLLLKKHCRNFFYRIHFKKVALIQYFMVCPASGFNTHHKSVYDCGFGDFTATRCEGFSSRPLRCLPRVRYCAMGV